MLHKKYKPFFLVMAGILVCFNSFAINQKASFKCKSTINVLASSNQLNELSARTQSKAEQVLRAEDIEDIININKIEDLKTLSTNEVFLVTFKDGTQGIWKEHIDGNPSSYKAEVLAYEFDQAHGFNLVPITVEKSYKGRKGSLQLFVKRDDDIDYSLDDFDRQRLFDFLIDNGDRHDENYFISTEGKLVSIDNGLAFFNIKGSYREKFVDMRSDMDNFLESKEGKSILRKLKKNLKDNKMQKELVNYLGKKDALRLSGRIEFILEYSKMMNSDIKNDVIKLYKIKNKTFDRLMMIVDLIKSHPIASKDKEVILLDILKRKDSVDDLLSSVLDALKYYGLSKEVKQSLISTLLKHPNIGQRTRESIPSFLKHNT